MWRANRNRWSILFFIGVQIFMFYSLSSAFATQESTRLPWSFLEQHRAQILQLASDEEALAFFHSTTVKETKSSPIQSKSESGSSMKPTAEIKEAITSYLASLAATTHAQTFREILAQSSTTILPSSPDLLPSEAQLQWILKHPTLQTLGPVVDFYQQISAWSHTTPSHTLPPDNEFAKFAFYYDQTYQDWDEESPLSWISIFKENGPKGIEDRLFEYWQTSDHLATQRTSSSTIRDVYAQHYIQTRLLPMFRANFLTHAVQLEATAYATAWKAWHTIQEWQQQQEQTKFDITRLCGTWRWIVHNHQNHGDRKMTLTFSPPDESPPSQIAPTTIEIHGDTVFLKWTFPQGVQEDSLLLSNNDTHLEGTFKNSLGPHGSISGKRLSTCRS
ncbi:MAG: hypothetical protein KC592_12610 [Nitrospira sp.]|nr:hypothetical protein [Nitrospira sp.]